jgi:membrane protease YdiL (CAAX protease family)
MMIVAIYFLLCLFISAYAMASNLGPASQVLVLLMGLAILPLQKFVHKRPITDLGFRRCAWKYVLKAFAIPLLAVGAVAVLDLMFGVVHIESFYNLKIANSFGVSVASPSSLTVFILLTFAVLFLLEFVTEELMFRGYLLGKLRALGQLKGLWISSIIFGLWHLPIASWMIGLDPVRTPLHLINMTMLGVVIGLVFLESNSLIPAALFHALWNALEYSLFGFADQQRIFVGATRTLFDPEEGLVGTIVLLICASLMLAARRKARGSERALREGVTQ